MAGIEVDPAGLAVVVADSFGAEFPETAAPLVDRLRVVASHPDSALWRLRLRYREAGELREANAGARLRENAEDVRREADALRTAEDIRLPAPRLWLEAPDGDPPFLLFDWVEGERFTSAWRRRDTRATAELLAGLLIELHEATDDGQTVLLHGDFTPDNVMMDRYGRPKVVAWSGARRGPAVLDVARAVQSIEESFGGALRAPFLRLYRRERPVSPEELDRALLSLSGGAPAQADPADRSGRGRDAAGPRGDDSTARARGGPGGAGRWGARDAGNRPPFRRRERDRG